MEGERERFDDASSSRLDRRRFNRSLIIPRATHGPRFCYQCSSLSGPAIMFCKLAEIVVARVVALRDFKPLKIRNRVSLERGAASGNSGSPIAPRSLSSENTRADHDARYRKCLHARSMLEWIFERSSARTAKIQIHFRRQFSWLARCFSSLFFLSHEIRI
jgi:hypothetical protein